MSWFKKEVEDWDLVGQALKRAEKKDMVRDVSMQKFNPDFAVETMLGDTVIVQEAVDSTTTIELDTERTIAVGQTGIQLDLGVDTETLKQIKGD
jgi:hypothetical protein